MTPPAVRIRAPLVLLASLTLAAACASTRIAQEQGTQGEVFGGERKRVIAKQPPETLLAIDKTSCQVSLEQYARVRLGQSVVCRWH